MSSSTSYPSCWAFDVDGVLGQTRGLVHEAYVRAGVRPPEESWGIEWKLWLPSIVGSKELAAEIHQQKQVEYEKLLFSGDFDVRLPGADLAQSLIDAGHEVRFVTAASSKSARDLLAVLGLDGDLLVGSELSPSMRTAILEFLRTDIEARSHTYVDDRAEGAKIAADAGWGFAHATWTR